ncbi:MAG: PAS domain-containing protein [Dyadobacter sp.]|uniref:PAS domain-containing protein n=1 Tax=Dyadobacter sp. TaxID=1914288 RepID=UPI0032640BC3
MKNDKEVGLEETGRVSPEIIYQDLFEYNPQPMWVYDVESYRILDVNEAAIRHYGYTKEEFLILTIKDLRPEKDIPIITAAVEIVKKHERLFTSGVYRHQKKNGEIIQVRIQGNIIYINGRKAELILVTDITALIVAETEKQVSNEKFKAIFQQTSDAILLGDDQGYCIDFNQAAVDMFGYSSAELKKVNLNELLILSDGIAFARLWQNFLNGDILNGVMKLRKKDGSVIFGDFNAKPHILPNVHLSVITDVTERMEKKIELIASERRFKALVQEGADLIAILDIEGNYMFVSESSARILGIPPEEFIGKNAFDYIHPEDREQVQVLFSTITEQKQIRTEPFRFIDSNGEYRWITTIATNLTDDPAVRGIVTNSRDITDTVTKSQDLERSNELYRLQNEKLKEIAWTQSHIVRAPLARLMGLIDLLQIGECGDLGKEGVLTHIKSSADELDRVVKDIVHKAD